MVTKNCSKCKLEKDVSEFSKNRAKKDGLNSFCRVCNTAYQAQWYSQHKDEHIQNVAKDKKIIAARNRAFVDEYLSAHPCVDCGETDIDVLQFDHVRGRKDKEVSVMVAQMWSLDKIQNEIAKCEVRCANHHIKRHAIERRHKWGARDSDPEPMG